ncbi:MAG: FecR domain-containing protein [Bacteroidetes bacterium]|nr:FecR domain-containing protein [Bacteroidota bacterium]
MENSQNSEQQPKDIKQAYRVAYLIAGFLRQTLTEEEKEELDQWILASDENMVLFEKMTDEKNIAQAKEWFKKMNVEEELSEFKKKIAARKAVRFRKYAVAAAVVILLGVGIYFFQGLGTEKEKQTIATEKQDIMPGSDKATLTLDNGRVIELGNEGTDTTINDRIKVLRKDGELIYNQEATAVQVAYHILSVPRKGQYKLVLPDGTKVWLNSESSIRYPIAFPGKERKVFVTGETFFEVAKDKSKPFRVVAGDVTVEALGTQFNVNAYSNEPFVAATLVEGSVMVTKGAKENIIKPGQQARLSENNFEIVNVATDDVIAWKNNQFKFTKTPLDAIMRQVERWYDADVVYQDKVDLHLNATIDRNVTVSKLLHILEETGQVHFKIEGRKIIVMN